MCAHWGSAKNGGGGVYSVLAYTKDPPPTPAADSTTTSLSSVMRWMPLSPRAGAHRNDRRSQDVLGNVSFVKRRPASRTPTRYPFSDRRSAATLPPKPLPTTTTS